MSISQRARHLASRLPSPPSRRLTLIGVAALLTVGGVGVWLMTRPTTEVAERTVAEATVGTYQTTVTATGTVEPRRRADLDFAVSGRVSKVLVTPGDVVAAGDVLARLDPSALSASLASAQAQLDAAETTAAEDDDETSVQRAAHDAAVTSAEVGVAEAQENLDAASLTATFTGTVASVSVESGDQVGSGSSVNSGGAAGSGTSQVATATSTTAVTVITPKTFVVEADVAADDIDQVSKDLQVTITPSGASEEIYGTVSAVGRVAEADDSGVATFPVTVSVTGQHEDLYAGTSADVSIIVQQLPDVLTVPTLAVTSEDGTTYVDKVEGSSTQRTAVEIGQTYGAATQIVSGLVEGDQIEVAPVTQQTGGTGGTQDRVPGQGRQGGGADGFGGGRAPGGAGPGGFGGNP